jgi:hypothetical protein
MGSRVRDEMFQSLATESLDVLSWLACAQFQPIRLPAERNRLPDAHDAAPLYLKNPAEAADLETTSMERLNYHNGGGTQEFPDERRDRLAENES